MLAMILTPFLSNAYSLNLEHSETRLLELLHAAR
jgi:hypothetical protein